MYNLSKKTLSVKKMRYLQGTSMNEALALGIKIFLIWAFPCVACFAILIWIWRYL